MRHENPFEELQKLLDESILSKLENLGSEENSSTTKIEIGNFVDNKPIRAKISGLIQNWNFTLHCNVHEGKIFVTRAQGQSQTLSVLECDSAFRI